jgi:protein-arginine kinase activator protein McsA
MSEMMWECKPCKVKIPMSRMDAVRKHLRTKRHESLKGACPRCSSKRMTRIKDETWDRDGIREAIKCERCRTEFKSFAHGIVEKYGSEYTLDKPEHIKAKEAAEFDREARARGYVKRRVRA